MTFRDEAQNLINAARELKRDGAQRVTAGELARKVGWDVAAVQTTLSYLDSTGRLVGVTRSEGADDIESTGKDIILGFDDVTDER